MSAETHPTAFLAAETMDNELLLQMHRRLSRWQPFLDALDCCPDPIAFLNEQRQIVLANRAMADFCGISDPALLLGRRMGEALNCLVTPNTPGGCGTGYGCRKCRLVNAIFSGLKWGGAVAQPQLHILRDAVEELKFRIVIESMASGSDRVLFCRLHTGPGVAMDRPIDIPDTPEDLFELHHLLVNGGPFCPY